MGRVGTVGKIVLAFALVGLVGYVWVVQRIGLHGGS